MSTAPAADRAVPAALLTRLVDDAALFPPGDAPMARALPDHAAWASGRWAGLVGPFICPASRLDELADLLGERRLDLSLVIDTGTGGVADAVAKVAADDRLALRAVEIPVRATEGVADAARRVAAAAMDSALGGEGPDAFVELPLGAGLVDALDVLAEYDLFAKIRTGGVAPDAYPTERTVAEFVVACLDRELAFKATAGLHHAVRRTEPGTGAEQHGFLNLLLAVRRALDGADLNDLTALLALRDGAAIAVDLAALTAEQASGVRRWFRSFGSCSIQEPVDDLVDLGAATEVAR